MKPIAFWILGSIALLAALWAVAARRPSRSVQALVAVMGSSAVIMFLQAAPLLASEMLLVIIGASLMVWMVLVRPGRMKLGTPGRARLNVTRLVAFFVALWLGALLVWALAQSPAGGFQPAQASLGASLGFWAALILLSSSVMTAWLVVSARRRDDSQEDEP
jgi:NADH:ubiquinone oxidoreductase subunit 6 (subunit J)